MTGGCPEKCKDGLTKRRTSLNPIPPVGMRMLSSNPMKVFLVPASEAHGKMRGVDEK